MRCPDDAGSSDLERRGADSHPTTRVQDLEQPGAVGAVPDQRVSVVRSNAFTIAEVRRGSQLAGRTPIWRTSADFGTVRMLSQLITESNVSPVSGPALTSTSVGIPRICDVSGARVTKASLLAMYWRVSST